MRSAHVSRRRLIVVAMLLPAPLLSTEACGAVVPSDAASLPDFRRLGDPDDTAALARAFATGRPVHAPAGQGSGTDGRYLIGNDATASLPAGANLFGDGLDRTVIARAPGPRPFILHCDSGSPDPARNIAGLRFRDLTFADDVLQLGFSEFSYLVMLNGVSDVRFDRVGFRGFRGDGLHLGSSVTSKVERHNVDMMVSDCVFDGVNANNRNAISVIDADRLVIARSHFVNVSRRGDGTAGPGDPMRPATGLAQPGAIDLEPNGDAFSIIRNVVIRDNLFVGGGGFAVAVLLPPNDSVRVPQQGIIIENNMIRDRVGAFEAFGYAGDDAANSQRSYNIVIQGNKVNRCKKPFIISGIRGITIADNQFCDCSGHAELGYRALNVAVTLSGNVFERVGSLAPGFALWLRDGDQIMIADNDFIDAGTPDSTAGTAIAVVSGTLRNLTLRGNHFRAPRGRMTQAAAVFQGARVVQSSLRLNGNEQLGVPLIQALNPPR